MKNIRIKYDYPLIQEFIFNYESTNEAGFTRAELAQNIVDTYESLIRERRDLFNDEYDFKFTILYKTLMY